MLRLSTEELMLSSRGSENTFESSLDCKEINPVNPKGNQPWLFIGRSVTETWCKEMPHWKRPWCWKRLKAKGEGDDRGWDGWMASPTRSTWVWVGYRTWWWKSNQETVVQSLKLCLTLCNPMDCSVPGSSVLHYPPGLFKLMSIELVMPSNHFILCCPLLLLPSIFPSIRVFSNESVLCIRWPKYWSFSFSIRPSSEYSGLISFRIDWFDLLAVQGTLRSLLQHHSSKASFFGTQLSLWSNSHRTTGKTIALTRQTFVSNVSAF